jgi:GT2 family glycosyltransferase/glycosyltransferase involved in cell wall biosynthesis
MNMNTVNKIFDREYIAKYINNMGEFIEEKDIEKFYYSTNNIDIPCNEWIDLEYIRVANKLSKDITPGQILNKINKGLIKYICPFFDEKYYLLNAKNNKINVDGEPFIHYIEKGWLEGLDPHPLFDTWYIYQTSSEFTRSTCPLLAYLGSTQRELISTSPFINALHLNHIRNQSIYEILKEEYLNTSEIHPNFSNIIFNYIENINGSEDAYTNKPLKTEHFVNIISKLRTEFILKNNNKISLSIIILNYKKEALTILSTYSAILSTNNIPSEIIIVNNESDCFTNELIYRYLGLHNNIRILSSTKNLYYGEGNNIAIDESNGEYILFLNNDAFINADLIRNFYEFSTKTKNFGGIAPISFNAKPTILEIGGTVTQFGDVIQNNKGAIFDYNFIRRLNLKDFIIVDYASAACLMIPKKHLLKYGGFKPLYEPFYYEDTDLCMRLSAMKNFIYISTRSYCLHLENTSTKEYLNNNFELAVNNSKNKFISSWFRGKNDIPSIPEVGTKAELEIAIYSPFDINIGGGENYILSVAESLSKDYKITIITNHKTSISRVFFILNELGIKYFKFELSTINLQPKKYYDIAIMMGNSLIPDWAPPAKKLLYHCQFPFPYCNANDYSLFDNIKYIDAYLVNSNFTKNSIEKNLSRYGLEATNIYILNPPLNNLTKNNIHLSDRQKKINSKEINFLSVGRFTEHGHCKNHHLLVEYFSRINYLENISLSIVGGLSTSSDDIKYFDKVKSFQSKSIQIDSNITKIALEDFYKKSLFYIHAAGMDISPGFNPHQCEHFGITVIEAMSFGCIPIVYKFGGPAEIVNLSGIGYIYSSSEELIMIIKKISKEFNKNKNIYLNNSKKAEKFAYKFNNYNFNKQINEIISALKN